MRKRLVALLLALSVSFSIVPAVYAAKSVDELKVDLEANRKDVEKTRKEIQSKQAEQNEYKKKKNAIDLEIAGIQADIDSVQSVIDEKTAEIDAKNAEIEQLETEIKETEKLLKQRMKVMYESGGVSYLDILLESDGLADFYTRMYVVETIVEHDNKLITDYKDRITRIEESKKTIEFEMGELVEARGILEEKRGLMRSKVAEQEAIIKAYQNDINELKRQEAEMERAERQIQAQIDAAMSTSTHKEVSYSGDGKFILPLASYTRISSPFGYRIHPITGTRKLHSGIDYAAPYGTAIYAAEDGVVLTSGWINGYGYTITINHGGGFVTLYAHCSSLIAKAGQKVKQGQTIARVGSTGNSTGNHLHFEVKVNGTAKDPTGYLK